MHDNHESLWYPVFICIQTLVKFCLIVNKLEKKSDVYQEHNSV